MSSRDSYRGDGLFARLRNAGGSWARSRLLLFTAAVALGICLLVVNQLHRSRAAIWQRALAENANLLFVVSSLVQGKLRSIDLALKHTAQHLQDDPQLQLDSSKARGSLFMESPAENSGLQVVLDHTGKVVRSSESLSGDSWAPSNMDYFHAHENNPLSGLFVSAPFASDDGDQFSISLSRRWTKPDGSFGGVVVYTLDIDVLQKLFSAVELGSNSGINLFLLDGTIVARFPYTGEHTGKSLAGTQNFDRFVNERQGSFTGVAAIDQIERLYTFRTLEGYPLLVNTAASTDRIFAVWRSDAIWLGITTLVLILACFVLAALGERELRAHRKTIIRLHRTEQEMRTVLDSLPAMVAYWDDALTNRFCNRAHEQWFGLSPEQAFGKHIGDVIGQSLFYQVDPYIKATLGGSTQVFQKPITDTTGAVRHTISTYIPDADDGKVRGFFVLVHDITERIRAEEALHKEKERFRVTLESISDAVITTDEQGLVTYENRAADMMTAWPLEQALGRPIEDVVVIEELPHSAVEEGRLIRAALAQRAVVKSDAAFVLISRTGQRTPIEGSAAPIFDEYGELGGAVLVFHDVSQARSLANELSRLAQYDSLTGVPNRSFIRQLAEQAMSRALRSEYKLALLYLDLDGFKAVNDCLGHAIGDKLLVTLTQRLTRVLRKGDALGRKGGDEFLVVMDSVRDVSETWILAARLIEACSQPVELEGQELSVTVSIGISIFPDQAMEYDELVRQADVAMYSAKHAGRNRACMFQSNTETIAFQPVPGYITPASHSCVNNLPHGEGNI